MALVRGPEPPGPFAFCFKILALEQKHRKMAHKPALEKFLGNDLDGSDLATHGTPPRASLLVSEFEQPAFSAPLPANLLRGSGLRLSRRPALISPKSAARWTSRFFFVGRAGPAKAG